jgi:mono/diheme cytochrome c family protein
MNSQPSIVTQSFLQLENTMLRRILRVIGIVLGSLVALLVVAAIVVYILSEQRVNKTYTIPAETAAIPTDEAAIQEGGRLAQIRGCAGCHTSDLSGDSSFIAGGPVGRIPAANLTAGRGGVGASYSDEDWVRAIRHGVNRDGKGLWIMPSNEFYVMSDEELGKLIAYLKTAPPVDKVHPARSLGPLFRVLLLAGQLPLLSAEQIDHTAARPSAPVAGVTVEYGQYIATTCSGCHGADYAGGPLPGAGPGEPEAANLTPGGVMQTYSEEQFIAAMRTGIRPDGSTIPNDAMPWQVLGGSLTDDELKALYLFFQSLPAALTGAG